MNKIKLIVFDLDGVLVEAKEIHYNALNEALGERYAIEWNEHLSIYDGLKTNQKLDMLTERKGLPVELHKKVWADKQRFTSEMLKKLPPNYEMQLMMEELQKEGYKIAVCSNSIRKTVLITLSKLGVIEYMDLILSNEDVINSKPHPEMYWNAISSMKCLPEETLIVEDSPYGLLAASRSKSHILRVKNPNEVTYDNIKRKINEIMMGAIETSPKWSDKN
jgi:HAD superfamily hydrolase (TIGR01509 family)